MHLLLPPTSSVATNHTKRSKTQYQQHLTLLNSGTQSMLLCQRACLLLQQSLVVLLPLALQQGDSCYLLRLRLLLLLLRLLQGNTWVQALSHLCRLLLLLLWGGLSADLPAGLLCWAL
jgi:hypothetical protein